MFAMITTLIALIICTFCMWFCFKKAEKYDASIWYAFLGIVFLLGSGIGAIGYMFLGWSWLASDAKAKIINREYNTNYTAQEIFYASEVIDTIRQIDRKRIELNGDLMRDVPEKE